MQVTNHLHNSIILNQVRQALWLKKGVHGDLSWFLEPHQVDVYDSIWLVIKDKSANTHVVCCSRQYGKTFTLILVSIEFCLKYPNSRVRFAAPFQKELMDSVDLSINTIIETAPEDVRPTLGGDHKLKFKNGSQIVFAGVDMNPNGLRGGKSHLNIMDECGFMSNMDYVYKSILHPQTLRTGGKTIFCSTPPITPDHPFTEKYREHSEQGRISVFTIWDNKSLTSETIQAAIDESGGRDSTTFQREYECKFVTDQYSQIVSEWSDDYIIKSVDDYRNKEFFDYFHKYESLDFGFNDNTAVLFAYYDYLEATLVIEDEFVRQGSQMTTKTLSEEIKAKEKSLWGENPKLYKRICDNNQAQLALDLSQSYGLTFIGTSKNNLLKTKASQPQGMVNKVKVWTNAGRVLVHPRCEQLIGCLKYGVWDKVKSDNKLMFARSPKYGHYDALASHVYLVRNVDEYTNPIPPGHGISSSTHFNPKQEADITSDQKVLMKALFPQSHNKRMKRMR